MSRLSIDLGGRSALVTGSTQGIGRAIAAGLAGAGAAVTINGRGAERVEAVVQELRAELPEARIDGVAADAATPEGAEALFGALPAVDMLVNNLGIFAPTPLFEIADATWQRFLDVNVMSGIRLTRHYERGCRPRLGPRGVPGVRHRVVIPIEMVHYGVTKTALLGVSRGFAKAWPARA